MMYYHLTPAKNVDGILQHGLQPRSYPSPVLFLFPSLSDAENAMLNWYGEEHSQEDLALLRIDIDPKEFDLKQEDGVLYEVYTDKIIPPSSIQVWEYLL